MYFPEKGRGWWLLGFTLPIFIFAIRKFIRKKPQAGLLELSLLGAGTNFIADVVYHTIIASIIGSLFHIKGILYFIIAVFGMSIHMGVISFFIAFQIKTRKTWLLILMIIAETLVVSLVWKFLLMEEDILR